MSHNLLQGKKGIIFGALDEQSIAWKTAESVCAQGGQIVLTNAPVALRMGTINALAEKLEAPVIAADATKLEDLENLVDQTLAHFGGKIDFVGWQHRFCSASSRSKPPVACTVCGCVYAGLGSWGGAELAKWEAEGGCRCVMGCC